MTQLIVLLLIALVVTALLYSGYRDDLLIKRSGKRPPVPSDHDDHQ
jgi:hypothetical protein